MMKTEVIYKSGKQKHLLSQNDFSAKRNQLLLPAFGIPHPDKGKVEA